MSMRPGTYGRCGAALALTLATLTLTACGSRNRTSIAVAPGSTVAVAPAAAPDRDYRVIVVAEAVDEVSVIRFGPGGAHVERRHEVGLNRADPDGPHGVAVAPDGAHYYVTTAHGTPHGLLWKYRTAGGAPVGRVELGQFPASLQVSPDGHYVYVVNFNLHGDMVPSSVSVVDAAAMVEIARLRTCTMPHGSSFDPQGTRHYSTCMMDDMLVEIDTRELAVARHFRLTPGREHGMDGAPHTHHMTAGHTPGDAQHGGAAHADTGRAAHAAGAAHTAGTAQAAGTEHAADAAAAGGAAGAAQCSPTWTATAPEGGRVYVACNASNDIAEVDLASWTLLRRIPAGDGVYNLAVTPDGRLIVATNKRGNSVSVIERGSGRELARVPTLRPVVHGVAISDDSRYAFISVEGIGSMPGTVEVLELWPGREGRRAAAVEVGQMAAGIATW
jgi:DNA-binding beta-propeller fold protein YncE